MKDFLKYLGALILLTWTLLLALEYSYNFFYQNSVPRNKIQNILQLKDQTFDLAFLGSSRTENHIDCALVERLTGKTCVNLGVSGASIGDMLLVLKTSLHNNVKFGKVIIQLDYTYNGSGTTPYFRANLVPFLQTPFMKDEILKEPDGYLVTWVPFYKYMKFDKIVGIREMFASVINEDVPENMKYGFWPQKVTGLRHVGTFPKVLNPENDELEQIEILCRDQNIELIKFTAPFCEKGKPKSFMDALEKRIPDLYNYVTLYDSKLENFADCGHLNQKGAQDFTEKFIRDLQEDGILPLKN